MLGTTADLVPPLLAAGSVWGHATAGVPPAMAGAVLTVAGHDHLVSCVASGIVDPDTMYDSMGTAEALVRVLDGVLDRDARARLAAHGVNVLRHLLPGRGVMLAATKSGLLMRRVLQLVGVHDAAGRAALDEQVMLLPDGPDRRRRHRGEERRRRARRPRGRRRPQPRGCCSRRRCSTAARCCRRCWPSWTPSTRRRPGPCWPAAGSGCAAYDGPGQRILPDMRFSERAEDTAYGAALIAAFAADPAADDLAAYLAGATQRAH